MGLGFEFGLQRIRDLAIVCPKSVAKAEGKIDIGPLASKI